MRTVVAYESMYGNTREIAEAIADGARRVSEVTLVAAAELPHTSLAEVQLLIVGGPTHIHSMSGPRTRTAAVEAAAKPGAALRVEADAAGPGLREWFATSPAMPTFAAAFDTRMRGPRVLTGSAARHIARKLKRNGAYLVLPAMSFLVRRDNHLVKGEVSHAREWGERAAGRVARAMPSNQTR